MPHPFTSPIPESGLTVPVTDQRLCLLKAQRLDDIIGCFFVSAQLYASDPDVEAVQTLYIDTGIPGKKARTELT